MLLSVQKQLSASVWYPSRFIVKGDQKGREYAFSSFTAAPHATWRTRSLYLALGWPFPATNGTCGRETALLVMLLVKTAVSVEAEGSSLSWNVTETPNLTSLVLRRQGSLDTARNLASSGRNANISCSAVPPSTASTHSCRIEGRRPLCSADNTCRTWLSLGIFTPTIDPAQSCLACGIRQDHSVTWCGCPVKQRDP